LLIPNLQFLGVDELGEFQQEDFLVLCFGLDQGVQLLG